MILGDILGLESEVPVRPQSGDVGMGVSGLQRACELESWLWLPLSVVADRPRQGEFVANTEISLTFLLNRGCTQD